MRENRQSGSEGGGTELNRSSLPLSGSRPPLDGGVRTGLVSRERWGNVGLFIMMVRNWF